MLLYEVGGVAHFLGGEDLARGVVGVVEDHEPCPVADGRAVPVVAGFLEHVGHGHGVEHGDARIVEEEAGRGDEHLVAGIEQGVHAQHEGFLRPGGDHDFGLGIVVQPVLALEVGGHGLAHGQDAPVVRVVDESLGQRVVGGGLDVLGRVEVRAADAEHEHFLSLAAQGVRSLGDGADGGGLQAVGDAGKPLRVHNCSFVVPGGPAERAAFLGNGVPFPGELCSSGAFVPGMGCVVEPGPCGGRIPAGGPPAARLRTRRGRRRKRFRRPCRSSRWRNR